MAEQYYMVNGVRKAYSELSPTVQRAINKTQVNQQDVTRQIQPEVKWYNQDYKVPSPEGKMVSIPGRYLEKAGYKKPVEYQEGKIRNRKVKYDSESVVNVNNQPENFMDLSGKQRENVKKAQEFKPGENPYYHDFTHNPDGSPRTPREILRAREAALNAGYHLSPLQFDTSANSSDNPGILPQWAKDKQSYNRQKQITAFKQQYAKTPQQLIGIVGTTFDQRFPTETKYQVTTPDGTVRTFTKKDDANKFAQKYGISQPVKQEPQGPPKPQYETVNAPIGNLQYLYGEKPELSSTGERLQYGLNWIEKTQNDIAKKPQGADTALVSFGLESGKDILSTGAFIENSIWQGESYITKKPQKVGNIEIPQTASGTLIESIASGKSPYEAGVQYEKTHGKGSVLGGIAMTLIPIPTPKGISVLSKLKFGKAAKVVKNEPLSFEYKPATRANEIDYTDNVLTEFKSTKVKLGKSETNAEKIQIKKQTKTVQPDITYKPANRANEIDYTDFGEKTGKASSITSKPVAATQKDVRYFVPKKTKTVQPDWTYRPSRPTANMLREDTANAKFQTKQIKLGKGYTNAEKFKPAPKTVQPDITYKPAKRANEIDYTDNKLGEFKSTKVKMGKGTGTLEKNINPVSKSPVNPDKLKRTWKNPENPYGESRRETKTSSGTLVMLEKQETKQELKLVTKTEQKTKPKAKKVLVQEQQHEQYTEIILHKDRPQSETIQRQKTGVLISAIPMLATKPRQMTSYVIPQRLASRQVETNLLSKEKQRQSLVIKPQYLESEKLTPLVSTKQKARTITKQTFPNINPQPTKTVTKTFFQNKPIQRLQQTNPTPSRLITMPVSSFTSRRTNKKKKKSKAQYNADFLGASSESSVFGITKREDITYGLRRTERLSALDLRKREHTPSMNNPETYKIKRKSKQENPDVYREKKFSFPNTKKSLFGKKGKQSLW